MVIRKNGDILMGSSWWSGDGPLIYDIDNPYTAEKGIEFYIALDYNEEQKAQYLAICRLKQNLTDSDWRAAKYADGGYTEEEYAPYKAQRAAWRAEINELEKSFNPPTLTREEMDYAEKIAMENWEKFKQKEEEEESEQPFNRP